MKSTPSLLLTLIATVVIATAASADPAKLPAASAKANITYATDIKPIFDASCVKCHSGDKAKARLHMDTLAGILKGTKQGKIVTPGNPEASLIAKSITHQTKDADTWMPPLHNKAGIKPLTPEETGLILGWIQQGAK